MDDGFEERIRDIRRRIAELRNRLHSTQPDSVQKPDKVVEQRQSVDEARERKNAELEEIKAKLLGRKK